VRRDQDNASLGCSLVESADRLTDAMLPSAAVLSAALGALALALAVIASGGRIVVAYRLIEPFG